MEFRIADTFTASLARLTNEEQKAVKTTAFDLQMNLASPGMQFHKLDRSRDPRFWSVRVARDIRLIVHKTDASLLLCYVGHHDAAYDWAGRRKLETHPKTGAAQFVEVRETVREEVFRKRVEPLASVATHETLFSDRSDDELLSFGVPTEWLPAVRRVDEDGLLDLADHLPAEAAEALLKLATGGQPSLLPTAPAASPFDHPDAQRRFRVMANVEELERALEFPWDRWTVFLHPAQRQWVERDYSGPARVSGAAGTGKTIVALHRAVFLARRHLEGRVLLTTFSETLAHALRTRLRRLISNEPRLGERIEVHAIDAIARRLYEAHFWTPKIVSRERTRSLLADAANRIGDHTFKSAFLLAEWEDIVDAWQIESWEEYRDVRRLGRKTQLREPQRQTLWRICSDVREHLAAEALVTPARMYARVAARLAERKHPPFEFVVVDEAQDLGVAQLRFLAAMGADAPNRLFFAGDLGQRIFQQPFSWLALGVDIRGRARTLHINYRTSHQIRRQADRLLGPEIADVDGNIEDRRTVSVFNGPAPEVRVCDSAETETAAVAGWLLGLSRDGFAAHEIGLFVRSANELPRALDAVRSANLQARVLDDHVETAGGFVQVGTMHLAKGLEFRAVAVMACDDEVIPQQERIESAAEDSDLEEVYNTALRRLHPRPRSSTGHGRETRFGVSRRHQPLVLAA
jgi:mRNA-degrading endonuclease RelE of RelBE toxin-antitoxin system